MASRPYRLVVEGELDGRFAVAFEDWTLRRAPGKTVLEGSLRDQAELLGLIHRIAALGLQLRSLEALDEQPGGTP